MPFEVPGWSQFVALIEGVLVVLATWTGSSGVAIILLTIAVKLAMVPLTLTSLRSAKRMQEIQPRIKELQKKYGHDRQLLSAETMKLYQEQRVNPFGSCLPIVIQMPIFFGLYYSILNIATHPVYAESSFSTSFLWIPNLAQPDPLYILVVVVTVTQFIQQRMAMPQRVAGQQLDQQQQMMNQMLQIMPLMVGFFAWNFAAGPVIYWITQNIFSAVQQYFITGFGSLRDLPGLQFLPVPRWAVPATVVAAGSKVVVTHTSAAGTTTSSEPSGLMGRLYQQINRRVEDVERSRAGEPAPPAAASDPAPSSDDVTPTRRSARRSRQRRS
ncbi:MAG: YidC/Oxa1 family membrane protein insertase [Chloroflexi bacterium]|nr:YidC/Oxa1 family membrane protein insertase [Chloroflexota bacterium]